MLVSGGVMVVALWFGGILTGFHFYAIPTVNYKSRNWIRNRIFFQIAPLYRTTTSVYI